MINSSLRLLLRRLAAAATPLEPGCAGCALLVDVTRIPGCACFWGGASRDARDAPWVAPCRIDLVVVWFVVWSWVVDPLVSDLKSPGCSAA